MMKTEASPNEEETIPAVASGITIPMGDGSYNNNKYSPVTATPWSAQSSSTSTTRTSSVEATPGAAAAAASGTPATGTRKTPDPSSVLSTELSAEWKPSPWNENFTTPAAVKKSTNTTTTTTLSSSVDDSVHDGASRLPLKDCSNNKQRRGVASRNVTNRKRKIKRDVEDAAEDDEAAAADDDDDDGTNHNRNRRRSPRAALDRSRKIRMIYLDGCAQASADLIMLRRHHPHSHPVNVVKMEDASFIPPTAVKTEDAPNVVKIEGGVSSNVVE